MEAGLEPYANLLVTVHGQVFMSRGVRLALAQALRSQWLKVMGFKAHGQPFPADCTLFFTFRGLGEETTLYVADISTFRIVEHGVRRVND